MLHQWAVVVGLSMTPALVLGQSAACAAGIAWHMPAAALVPVVAVSSFVEGVVVAWLAGATSRAGFLQRWLDKLRKPKVVGIAEKWGVWGGLFLGVAAVGQEPILVALRALGVGQRRLWLPLALSNAVFAIVYYAIVKFGIDRISAF